MDSIVTVDPDPATDLKHVSLLLVGSRRAGACARLLWQMQWLAVGPSPALAMRQGGTPCTAALLATGGLTHWLWHGERN